MHLINLITLVTTLLFTNLASTAAILQRDNACTACLAMIDTAVTNHTQILNGTVCDDTKKTIMHDEVCGSLAETPLYSFCTAYVEMWSPGLYHYLMENSTDPKVVCASQEFHAC